MTHAEVKGLWDDLNILVQYISDNKINNTYMNYGLKKNARILEKATKLIQDSISPELIEIEKKVIELGTELAKELPAEEKNNINVYRLGFPLLTQEEKDRHAELAVEYTEFLQKESDVKLYYLDLDEVKHTKLEWQPSSILENFIKE